MSLVLHLLHILSASCMWSNEHLLSLAARFILRVILRERVIDGENSHRFSSATCPEVRNLQISVLILICLGSPLPPWGPNLFVLSVERSDSEAAEENNFSASGNYSHGHDSLFSRGSRVSKSALLLLFVTIFTADVP